MRPWVGSPRRVAAVVHAWAALAAFNLATQPVRAVRDFQDTDYVFAFMTGSRMLHDGTDSLYVRAAQRAARDRFLHVVPTGASDFYTNPPLAAWLIQPIAVLPPEVSLVVFLAISLVAVAGAAWLLAERMLAGLPAGERRLLAIVAVATVPGAETFALVNWDALLVLAAALALVAALARRPLLAGALLSVLCVKPQTAWLIPVALLCGRHWRAVGGFGIGVVVWVASTLVLVGTQGMRDWWENNLPAHLGEAHQTIGIPGVVASVVGAGGGIGFASSAALLVAAVCAGWWMRGSLRADLAATVALGLAASALCAPHVWPEDVIILAAPLALLGRWSLPAALAAVAAVDLAYCADSLAPSLHTEALAIAFLVIALVRGLRGELRRRVVSSATTSRVAAAAGSETS